MPDTTAPPATTSTTEPPDTTTQEQQQQEPGKAKGDEKEAKRPRTRSSMLVVKEVKPRVVSPDVEEEEELDFECDINTPSAISRPLMIQPKADEEPAPSPEPSSPPPPPPGSPPPAQRDDNNDKVPASGVGNDAEAESGVGSEERRIAKRKPIVFKPAPKAEKAEEEDDGKQLTGLRAAKGLDRSINAKAEKEESEGGRRGAEKGGKAESNRQQQQQSARPSVHERLRPAPRGGGSGRVVQYVEDGGPPPSRNNRRDDRPRDGRPPPPSDRHAPARLTERRIVVSQSVVEPPRPPPPARQRTWNVLEGVELPWPLDIAEQDPVYDRGTIVAERLLDGERLDKIGRLSPAARAIVLKKLGREEMSRIRSPNGWAESVIREASASEPLRAGDEEYDLGCCRLGSIGSLELDGRLRRLSKLDVVKAVYQLGRAPRFHSHGELKRWMDDLVRRLEVAALPPPPAPEPVPVAPRRGHPYGSPHPNDSAVPHRRLVDGSYRSRSRSPRRGFDGPRRPPSPTRRAPPPPVAPLPDGRRSPRSSYVGRGDTLGRHERPDSARRPRPDAWDRGAGRRERSPPPVPPRAGGAFAGRERRDPPLPPPQHERHDASPWRPVERGVAIPAPPPPARRAVASPPPRAPRQGPPPPPTEYDRRAIPDDHDRPRRAPAAPSAAPPRGPVRMVAGGCTFGDPGRDKVVSTLDRLNEDAFYHDDLCLAVADGLGATISYFQVSSSQYAQSLARTLCGVMSDRIQQAKSQRRPFPDALLALQHAYVHGMAQERGAATVCMGALDEDTGRLHVVRVGDSGFYILRPTRNPDSLSLRSSWRPFERSHDHPRGHHSATYLASPALAKTIGSAEPAEPDADLLSADVIPGDVIIFGTDGFFDSVDLAGPSGAAHRSLVYQRAVQHQCAPRDLAEELCHLAHRLAADPSAPTPFRLQLDKGETEVQQNVDDVAVVVAYVLQRT